MRTIRRVTLVSTLAACLAVGLWLATATPQAATMTPPGGFPAPDLVFRMSDGAALPARLWQPAPATPPAGIILALHGFTDSRDAWEYPAPAFAAAGYTVVAPDQRGFGATATRGIWAGQDRMIADAAELAAQLRARYPGRRLVLMGESMGGAVAMCLAARAPATADTYVIESPAVWGLGQLAPGLRAALWTANAVAPGWRLTGQEVPQDIAASDNREALLRLAHDTLTLRGSTVATLHGLVELMTSAQDAAGHLPPHMLILSGRRDQIIPQDAIAAAWAKFPPTTRRAFYLGGFHLLYRDTGRALPTGDTLAWLAHPDAWLPSGADVNAAAWVADHAWQGAPAVVLDDVGARNPWPY